MNGLDDLMNLDNKKESSVEKFKKKNTGASLKEFGDTKKKKEFDAWYIEKNKSQLLKTIVEKLGTKNNTFLEKVINDFIESRVGEISNLIKVSESEIKEILK